MPTYAGGLGVLAGDTIRSAADLQVPTIAVSLIHRKGYFRQAIDSAGWQKEAPVEWPIEDYLQDTLKEVTMTLEGRTVHIRAWRYEVIGVSGFIVPVIFLDTDLPQNAEADRGLTHHLYGGDSRYRICQELILGIGGVRALRALGYKSIERFHMNEGHAAFLTLELLEEEMKKGGRHSIHENDIEEVRKKCVFTTHTPVPAGHDQFPIDQVASILGAHPAFHIRAALCRDKTLNMTYLALNFSHYVNGVAEKHGEVSRRMFPSYEIDSITNGIHLATWASKPFQALFDKYIPGWKKDNFSLRSALAIPKKEIRQKENHITAKAIRLNPGRST